MRARATAIAMLLAAALTAIALRGLWRHVDAAIPGSLGDNVAFVWNTWWAPRAWARFPAVFQTPLLFAPWGSDLTLHTHTLLPSTLAAALPGANVIRATNLVVAAHLALNAICAYALAFRLTRRIIPSSIAAVVFAWSPYVTAHLAGHFNLIAAWVLPLFALVFLRTLEDPGPTGAILLGIVFGAIPYIDYYYLVYAAGLGIVVLAHRTCHVSLATRPAAIWQRRVITVCALLFLIDLAILAIVVTTGGTTITVAGKAVSVRGVENPAAAAGFLVMIAIAVALLPRLRGRIDRGVLAGDLDRLSVPSVVAALLLAPLAMKAVALWRQGGYVTQTYFWRSAPAGIDVGTLLLGNPGGAFWGGVPAGLFEHLRIDGVERVAWLGPGVMALSAAAILRERTRNSVRLWMAIGIAFLVWALGPRLQAFGHDLHVFLPGVLVRYVPLASNARMPGRAVVVVYLAAAMLAALGAQGLLARGRRSLVWGLLAVVILDFLPRQTPFYRPDRPAIYDTIARASGPGSVCELPMGLRDGFGETGRLDMRVLFYQTLHGRPMTGGFVARLDPRVLAAYQVDPVLGVLLRLSAGATLASQQTLPASLAGESLRLQGIRFVVLNRREAAPDLVRYVDSGLPLRAVQEDEERTLYELAAPVNAAAESRFR